MSRARMSTGGMEGEEEGWRRRRFRPPTRDPDQAGEEEEEPKGCEPGLQGTELVDPAEFAGAVGLAVTQQPYRCRAS